MSVVNHRIISALILIMMLLPLQTMAAESDYAIIDESSESTSFKSAYNTETRLLKGEKQQSNDSNINDKIKGFESILLFDKILASEKLKILTGSPNEWEINLGPLKSDGGKHNRCFGDVQSVLAAARKREEWALQMIDAIGKPGSGILRHNVRFLGDFDECMDLDPGPGFQGRYCRSLLWVTNIRNITFPIKVMHFTPSFCLPSSCDTDILNEFLNAYLQSHPDINGRVVRSECQEPSLTLDASAKIVITICSIIGALVLMGTAYDVLPSIWLLVMKDGNDSKISDTQPATEETGSTDGERKLIADQDLKTTRWYNGNTPTQKEESHKWKFCAQLLMSFSAYTNTRKLLSTSTPRGSIDCIHGIRFITNTWVMLFHTYVFGLPTSENYKLYLEKAYKRWTFAILPAGVISVDSFFTMSGLCLCYSVLQNLGKTKLTPKFFGSFYLHRFWRLTPTYMFVLMFFAAIFKYISDGPLWKQGGFDYGECKDAWWTNLLYLNNFVKENKICMSWSWYLANDMQMYIVSPLLFLPLFLYGWKGLLSPLLFLLGTVTCTGIISSVNNLQAVKPINYLVEMPTDNWNTVYYDKPYTRIGPFIVGMIAGFLLLKSERKARLSKLQVALGWCTATAVALAVLYGPYKHVVDNNPLSTDVAALYTALHSTAWGVSLCWVIFACANGYGGIVDTILSWRLFIPLSKLSYCAYLIHIMVVDMFLYSQRRFLYLNTLNMVYIFTGIVVISYAFAIVTHLAFEAPMVDLEKLIKQHRKKASREKT